jgi:hypothetical protein
LDIESHASVIKSVVQLCQEYSDKFLPIKKRRKKRRTSENAESSSSVVKSSTGAPAAAVPACPAISIGQVIEQRWHQLWLRSLEWQCFLEQLAWKSNKTKKVRNKKV